MQRESKNRIERFLSAYRRVGLRGLFQDLRWRFRQASAGRGLNEAIVAGTRLLVQRGPKVLMDRVRFGAHRFLGSGQSTATEAEPHSWTTTFAHAAAFNPHFDLDAAVLASNREIVGRFNERKTEVRTATWFLTYFDHALFGGVHTILRLMDYMARQHGVAHRLVIFDRPQATDSEIREAVIGAFPSLERIDIVLPTSQGVPYEELPYTDVAICTIWISAFPLARFNRTKAKFYMVQDYEPVFYPAGTLSALAEATYRLGFAGIVNTPGLANVYRSYGNPTTEFVPSVDSTADRFDKPSQRGGPVQIVVYGRPSTDRNAFELIASASLLLKRQYSDRVRIVSAGEDWNPQDLGLDGVIENRGRLASLDAVHELYRASDIGLCFMLSKHPSYQPLEYLASYVTPVCNLNEATRWLLRNEENCLTTEVYPSEIARTVARLIEDEGLRQKIAEAGHDEIAARDWEAEFEHVWRFMTNRA